jgi:hypothetical protein
VNPNQVDRARPDTRIPEGLAIPQPPDPVRFRFDLMTVIVLLQVGQRMAEMVLEK